MKIKTYREFWPYYLEQHRSPATRHWHVVGAVVGIVGTVAALFLRQPLIFVIGTLLAYGIVWAAHFIIEKNRPATWGYPVWSFISEFRMIALVLLGRL